MTKTIIITLAHTHHRTMSDGCGNDLTDGQVVTIGDEHANAFLAKGFARPADGVIVAKAKAQATEAFEQRQLALRKMGAAHRMELWDSLPADVRARANEEGEHVVDEYLDALPSMSLETYEAAPGEPFAEAREAEMAAEQKTEPKRRGRQPKPKTTSEGGDANE